MRELALFAGAGGGILGGVLLGWRTVCAVEIDPYCRRVLMQRQNDGVLDPFPIWDDVRAFDGTQWRGRVDVVSGGFPCQPFSVAGKRLADADERNLWPETARVLGEVRPRYALLENVPGLAAHPYFERILCDLAALGYDARWGIVGADDVGAPHRRERLWIVAHAHAERCFERGLSDAQRHRVPDAAWRGWVRASSKGSEEISDMADADESGSQGSVQRGGAGEQRAMASAGRGAVADSDGLGCEHEPDGHQTLQFPRRGGSDMADTDRFGPSGSGQSDNAGDPAPGTDWEATLAVGGGWWGHDPAEGEPESSVGRVAHGWPMFWTSLESLTRETFDDWKTKHRPQGRAEDQASSRVRAVWWDHDPADSPQRPQPDEQRPEQLGVSLSVVPHEGTHDGLNLGSGSGQDGDLRGMREPVSAEAFASGETLRAAILPQGERTQVGRVAVGVKHRVDRLKALGNGQVPAVARIAWEVLK